MSNEDPAKSRFESKRRLNVEGVFLSAIGAPNNFLVRRFQNLDSKDLGLWDLGMENDRTVSSREAKSARIETRSSNPRCTARLNLNVPFEN